MRVLYLTMNPNRVSTTVPTEGWFRLLRPRGLEPVLVSSRSGAFQAWTKAEGMPSYELPLPWPDRRRLGPFLTSLVRLYLIGRRHRVQLVHCNEHDIYPIGQYVARLLRVPVVLSVHFTLRDGFSTWAFGGKRGPDRIFFISRGSLEACRPDVAPAVPESRWRLLYNGIDLQRFRPDTGLRTEFRAAHRIGDGVAIGVACALRPRKQIEHLFQAAARVPDVRVVLAGGPVAGDEVYAAGLLAMGRDLLGDRLVTVGHLEDLRGFYNALDLFVNTSQEEACSISVIESMASGTPVLGYPSTSVDEQVVPDGGEIVAQDDIAALAQALGAWVSDAARLRQARIDARRRAESMFDIERLAGELYSEYDAVLGTGGARGALVAGRTV